MRDKSQRRGLALLVAAVVLIVALALIVSPFAHVLGCYVRGIGNICGWSTP